MTILYLVRISQSVMAEFKRIIQESEVSKEDDNQWPVPDKVGRQELEFRIGREHISFTVSHLCICYFVMFIVFIINL